MEKYIVCGKIGEGSFSEVLKAKVVPCSENGGGYRYVAIKCIKGNKGLVSENPLESKEVLTLRKLNPHSNIIQLLDAFRDHVSQRLCIVTELMHMNLYEFLQSYGGKPISESVVKPLIWQALCGLAHLHRSGLFHRDIKPENLLLSMSHDDNQLKLKIGDFGSCRDTWTSQPYTEYIATRWYRAPECLLTNGFYSLEMDLWSIGCVMYELLAGKPLFPGRDETLHCSVLKKFLNNYDLINDIYGLGPFPWYPCNKSSAGKGNLLSRTTPYLAKTFPSIGIKTTNGITFTLDHLLPNCSQEGLRLLKRLLTYNPSARISATSAMTHCFFDSLRCPKVSYISAVRNDDDLKKHGHAPTNTSITTNTSKSDGYSRSGSDVESCFTPSNTFQSCRSSTEHDTFMTVDKNCYEAAPPADIKFRVMGQKHGDSNGNYSTGMLHQRLTQSNDGGSLFRTGEDICPVIAVLRPKDQNGKPSYIVDELLVLPSQPQNEESPEFVSTQATSSSSNGSNLKKNTNVVSPEYLHTTPNANTGSRKYVQHLSSTRSFEATTPLDSYSLSTIADEIHILEQTLLQYSRRERLQLSTEATETGVGQPRIDVSSLSETSPSISPFSFAGLELLPEQRELSFKKIAMLKNALNADTPSQYGHYCPPSEPGAAENRRHGQKKNHLTTSATTAEMRSELLTNISSCNRTLPAAVTAVGRGVMRAQRKGSLLLLRKGDQPKDKSSLTSLAYPLSHNVADETFSDISRQNNDIEKPSRRGFRLPRCWLLHRSRRQKS